MSFFAKPNRYLTRGKRLMIHERKLSKKLQIEGPLTTCVATVQATLNGRNRRTEIIFAGQHADAEEDYSSNGMPIRAEAIPAKNAHKQSTPATRISSWAMSMSLRYLG